MSKILLIGEICAEKQYLINKVPAVKEVELANEINSLTSSKIINAGRILAFSNNVSIFGVVGQDDDGKKAIEDLKKYEINPKLIYKTSKSSTAQVLVLTDKNGQSAIILHLAAINYLDESKLTDISQYDYLYMATSMKLTQLYKLMERAHKENVGVFLDFPNQQKDIDKEKLRTINFVVPNRQEAELILNTKITNIQEGLIAVTKLKSFTDGNVVITLDTDGCVAFGKDWKEPKHFRTEIVKAVDETGSGDIFRGVLLSEYLKTNDLESSIKKALSIATESVKYSGVNNSIEQIKNK